ncbi:MAG TPA: protein translocase subunit SecF [Candidatus Acidoferrales bacterium]|nr:protein translocase subunit SecF [Candidatus Acidoferrales bacterium]
MFFRRLNWNIVSWFRTIQTISYLVIAIGFGAMIFHGFQGGEGFRPSHMLRLGLSFTGGTEVDVAFTHPTTTAAVRSALAPLDLADESLNTVGTDGKHFTVDTTTSFANNSVPLKDALNKAAPLDMSQFSITAIGPTLGAEYLRDALWALVIALSIQFIYIAFRFGWNYIFGLVTVIALVRDAAMMIGIYAIADRPADDAFLAAVLTVIGYSVMDTIVILDRIRENTKIMVGVAYDTIVNESIKQTMTRSFNTLATVVITLVALLALGGASLKNFAFALLVGICSGGYHSIFYSAPLVLVFRKRQLETAARKRRAALSASSGSGPAKVENAGRGASRDDIVAARRQRREQQKSSTRNPQTTPARYRRKRTEATAPVETIEPEEADDSFDPLEHEEVKLNLEGFDLPAPEHEPDGAHQE